MELTTYSGFQKMEKSIIPTFEEMKEGALVLYRNGYLETILGHIRFAEYKDKIEWTAGSSDDVTNLVKCWFKKK